MTGIYLMFNRNCKEALDTYSKAFNTKVISMQCYKDMPANPNFPIKEEDMDLVLHSQINIDGVLLMCADSTRNTTSNNMYISINGNVDSVKHAWNLLKDNGIIYMDLKPSFFAKLHGSLQDKFGVNWMFSAN